MAKLKNKLVLKIDDLCVEIIDHPPYIDVHVSSYSGKIFKLQSKYQTLISDGDPAGVVTITDILGNGYGSDYQNKGVGTFLVNTAIQYYRHELPGMTEVKGQMSDVGDPTDDPEELERCRRNRHDFWGSFNFNIDEDGEWGRQEFRARLDKLKMKTGHLMLGKFPAFYRLEDYKLSESDLTLVSEH